MARPTLTAVYFILTFLGGAAVGSWALWVYLMGAGGGAMPAAQTSAPEESALPASIAAPPTAPVPPPAQPSATAPEPPPIAETVPETVKLRPAAPDEEAGELPSAPPAAMPRKEPVAAIRSHEECLALTKALNDAYKDCRFGTSKPERDSE